MSRRAIVRPVRVQRHHGRLASDLRYIIHTGLRAATQEIAALPARFRNGYIPIRHAAEMCLHGTTELTLTAPFLPRRAAIRATRRPAIFARSEYSLIWAQNSLFLKNIFAVSEGTKNAKCTHIQRFNPHIACLPHQYGHTFPDNREIAHPVPLSTPEENHAMFGHFSSPCAALCATAQPTNSAESRHSCRSFSSFQGLPRLGGGEGGIRTHVTVARKPHFECGAFDLSATSPRRALSRAWARGRPRSAAVSLTLTPCQAPNRCHPALLARLTTSTTDRRRQNRGSRPPSPCAGAVCHYILVR